MTALNSSLMSSLCGSNISRICMHNEACRSPCFCFMNSTRHIGHIGQTLRCTSHAIWDRRCTHGWVITGTCSVLQMLLVSRSPGRTARRTSRRPL